jgi:hypothetical protein
MKLKMAADQVLKRFSRQIRKEDADKTYPRQRLSWTFTGIQPSPRTPAGRLVNGPILISEQRPAGGARRLLVEPALRNSDNDNGK